MPSQNNFLSQSHLANTSNSPFDLEIEKAEGIYLYSTDGKRYIDLISGISVSNLGHGHPKIKKAIKNQVDKHLHVMVYGEYLQAAQNKFAKKLTSVLPENLDCVYFVNSGTEANEGGLKLAKRYTGRTEIISCKGAYHGSTHGSLSVSGNEEKKYAFRPLLPDVRFMEFGEEKDLAMISEKTACVIMETIQADAGVRIPTQDYMKALREKCYQTGTLLILDEIQVGLGRTGKLFSFEYFGIVPDILTLGKALGGGMPIGVFMASKKIMNSLATNPPLGHITTFGGHPVPCAAGLVHLEILLEENIISEVNHKGQLFVEKLHHPLIKEVRQKGLLFAIEMENFELVNQLVKKCKEKGLIAYWFLSTKNSFRIAPPLTITETEIEESCSIILEALDEVAGNSATLLR